MPNILEYFNITSHYEALLFIPNILLQSHFWNIPSRLWNYRTRP